MKNNINYEKCGLLFDFYELAQSNGFLSDGIDETTAYFDLYHRNYPELGGFSIMSGVEQFTQAVQDFSFTEDEIDFLAAKGLDRAFLEYLRNFNFMCDIWAVPDGTPIFSNEPVVKVKGPVIQAQLLETALMQTISHQTLIATKYNRIVRASQGREVIEIGSRRAHGGDASLNEARAAYISGCTATTNTAAAMCSDIPLFCGMSSTWVQMFDSELEAFCAYAKKYPDDCILLIDTYDATDKGLPAAIEAFNRVLVPMGKRPKGVCIETGDLGYISKKVRRALNDAGFPDCNIYASNALDEDIIRELLQNGARIDGFLVGDRLLTASGARVAGGVYKLTAIEKNGKVVPKIKLSENVSKITTPCPKLLWRLFDSETGKAIADLVTLEDENIGSQTSIELFDPDYTWKRKTVDNFVARQLLQPVFTGGKPAGSLKPLTVVRNYCAEQIDSLWEEVLRFEYPHNYYVDQSQRLWDIRKQLIDACYK